MGELPVSHGKGGRGGASANMAVEGMFSLKCGVMSYGGGGGGGLCFHWSHPPKKMGSDIS